MPDITRLFKGRKNEFGVEVVFAKAGEKSPKESHSYIEIVLLVEGSINIDMPGSRGGRGYRPYDTIMIPPHSEHQIEAVVDNTKIVIVHPDRSES